MKIDGGLFNHLSITSRDSKAPLASELTVTGDGTHDVEDAVVGIKIRGFLGWLAWLFVHIYYLIGFRNRAEVLILLARRIAQHRPADEWYWRAALPGWQSHLRGGVAWLGLLQSAHEIPEAPIAAAGGTSRA